MKQYLDLMRHIRDNGTVKADRTGTGTTSIFGHQMRFDLQSGFPLVTTKKCSMKAIIHELLWFLQGDTNVKYLQDNGVTIWDEWCSETGDLGPIYGKQWRSWQGKVIGLDNVTPIANDGKTMALTGKPVHENIDQISVLIERLKTNPDCRRLIVSAWNVGELADMALAPCHCFFQFYTTELTFQERWKLSVGKIPFSFGSYSDEEITELLDENNIPKRKLSCQLYQRSLDTLLGGPFNIASYALLTMMIAQVVNMIPSEFIHTVGDAHLYSNHKDQVEEQLSREPRALPKMKINPEVKDIFSFKYEDFTLLGYDPYPAIKAPVAI